MHGAHKSRNVLIDKSHPQYKTGQETKAAKAKRSQKSLMLRRLSDLGNFCRLFSEELKTLGRPPMGYKKLDLNEPEQMALAIRQTIIKPSE